MATKLLGHDAKDQENEGSKLVPVPIDPATHKLMGTNLAISAKCGMCVHFGNMKHPAYESVCKELGILEENTPCTRYEPDYRQLQLAEQPWFSAFAASLSQMTGKQRHILASLLMKENRTRRAGFFFGETVYMRVFEGDYLSNYRRGVIVSATSKHVYIEGRGGFHAMLMRNSVMTTKQWLRKKQELIRANRLKDPFLRRYVQVPTNLDKKIQDIIEQDKLDFLEAQTRELNGMVSRENNAPPKGKIKNPRYMTLVELIEHGKTATDSVGTIRTRGS